jgi:hypothetical protein
MPLKKESDFNNQHLFTEGLYFQYFGEMRDLEFLSGFSGLWQQKSFSCTVTDTIRSSDCTATDTKFA